ncbi:MAG: DUF4493 domain-containing protein [Alistipes senegalensis]
MRTETAATDGEMELPTGSYKLEVRSRPSSQLADWDHPVYFAARDFAIEKNEDTVLEGIVYTLSNIKVAAHVLQRPRGPVHRRNNLHDLAGRNVDGLCQG